MSMFLFFFTLSLRLVRERRVWWSAGMMRLLFNSFIGLQLKCIEFFVRSISGRLLGALVCQLAKSVLRCSKRNMVLDVIIVIGLHHGQRNIK